MPWYGDPALRNLSYNSKKAVPNGSTPVSGMAARTIGKSYFQIISLNFFILLSL